MYKLEPLTAEEKTYPEIDSTWHEACMDPERGTLCT